MEDYDRLTYNELSELAKLDDPEATKRIDTINRKIKNISKYCHYALTGEKKDYIKGVHSALSGNLTVRALGRRMLEIRFPVKQLFYIDKRLLIEKYVRENYEEGTRPDWMDLIARAVYLCLHDPEIYGNFSVEIMFEDRLRKSKQKRRGLLLAAVGNEIEKSLFGGITSSTNEYKKMISHDRNEQERRDIYESNPSEWVKIITRERVRIESESKEKDIISDVMAEISELGFTPEDKELLYIEQGDIKRIANERGVAAGTLRQKRKRLIDKILKKMM